MDAHYDQVMRAREQANAEPRLYFGYSSVLDRSAFEDWRAQHGYQFFELPKGELAEALDVDVTFDFPSRFWGGRVLGLREAPGKSVHGMLWTIGGKDWPIIAHKEGAITGMCIEQQVRVRVGSAVHTATAFVTAPGRRGTDGPVSKQFVAAVRRGMVSAGLPAEYIARFEAAASA